MGRKSRTKHARRIAGLGTSRVPPAACPVCFKSLDAATGVELDTPIAPRPGPGDVTVCNDCTSVLVFADDMSLRVAGAHEIARLDPELQKLVRLFVAERAGKGS